MISIFLSYARGDDEPFVNRLYHDLIAKKFEVWFDRVSMPSRALTFHQEIRDAITASDRLILVVGPGAVSSDYVNQEWRWALELGKCINLIVRLDGQNKFGKKIDGYPLIPEELKLIHAEDFRNDSEYQDRLAHLERQLADPAPPLGKLIAVPTLPAHYRSHTDRLKQLRDLLLVDLQTPIVVTGAVARVGVQGMGGIGKSVLASALARNQDIRRAFPDGIFWIGVGQHPKLVELQKSLVKNLGGDPVFEDIHTGKNRLHDLLEHRAALLILDDVWNSPDADAFDVVGVRSKLMVTTRDAGLVTAFTGMAYQVQLPSLQEALALLATAARLPFDALPKVAEEIATECGRLPLALALCGSMAAKGQTWERILQMLRGARLKLIADRQEIDETHRSIWRAMEVSVKILKPDEQQRFAELAVFSAAIPEEAIFTLWQHTGGLDELDAADLLMNLYERSLIIIDRPAGSIGTGNAHVSLHDLLFDFAMLKAIDQYGTISGLHNELLDAYAEKCTDGWATGPDDGYFLQYIGKHLVTAGKEEQLLLMLSNFDWLDKKVDAGLLHDLIDDYDLGIHPDSSDLSENAKPTPEIKNGLKIIQGALRLSAHVLAQKPKQLPSQLVGRLLGFEDPVVRAFIERVNRFDRYPWFRPITPSLTPPGGLLIQTLYGHTDAILNLDVTPDGKRAVSVSADKTLKVWDLETGQELYTLTRNTENSTALALTSNGKLISYGSDSKTLNVWDLESGKKIHSLNGHISRVRTVKVTSDGKRAISGSDDHTLKIWDIESGQELHTLSGHTGSVRTLALTSDGKWAVSGSEDNTLKIWDIEVGNELHTLVGHNQAIMQVALTLEGKRIVSGSIDNTLKVWDLETGCEIHTLIGHTQAVIALAVTPDGKRVISGGSDERLRLWDLETGQQLGIFSHIERRFWRVVVTPDSRRAISTSDDDTINVWDLESGRKLYALGGPRDRVSTLAMSSDGRWIVSSSDDNTLKLWDLEPALGYSTITDYTEWTEEFAITSDGKRAVSGSDFQTLNVWDLESGQLVETIGDPTEKISTRAVTPDGKKVWVFFATREEIQREGLKIENIKGACDRVKAVVVTPDGKRAVTYRKNLNIWDMETGRVLHTRTGHTSAIHAVIVTLDGKRAVSGSDDKNLKVWDLETGQELHTLTGHSGSVRALALTQDGKRVISGSDDKNLKVWDLETGQELHTLTGHSGSIRALALTQDGKQAVSGSDDKNLKVWDLETGQELHTLTGHSGSVRVLALTRDGKQAVSGSDDKYLKVWDLETGQELHTLTGHSGSIRALELTRDGKRVISGSDDKTLKAWDLESGIILAEFERDNSIIAFSFSDTLDMIIAGDESDRIFILYLVERPTAIIRDGV